MLSFKKIAGFLKNVGKRETASTNTGPTSTPNAAASQPSASNDVEHPSAFADNTMPASTILRGLQPNADTQEILHHIDHVVQARMLEIVGVSAAGDVLAATNASHDDAALTNPLMGPVEGGTDAAMPSAAEMEHLNAAPSSTQSREVSAALPSTAADEEDGASPHVSCPAELDATTASPHNTTMSSAIDTLSGTTRGLDLAAITAALPLTASFHAVGGFSLLSCVPGLADSFAVKASHTCGVGASEHGREACVACATLALRRQDRAEMIDALDVCLQEVPNEEVEDANPTAAASTSAPAVALSSSRAITPPTSPSKNAVAEVVGTAAAADKNTSAADVIFPGGDAASVGLRSGDRTPDVERVMMMGAAAAATTSEASPATPKPIFTVFEWRLLLLRIVDVLVEIDRAIYAERSARVQDLTDQLLLLYVDEARAAAAASGLTMPENTSLADSVSGAGDSQSPAMISPMNRSAVAVPQFSHPPTDPSASPVPSRTGEPEVLSTISGTELMMPAAVVAADVVATQERKKRLQSEKDKIVEDIISAACSLATWAVLRSILRQHVERLRIKRETLAQRPDAMAQPSSPAATPTAAAASSQPSAEASTNTEPKRSATLGLPPLHQTISATTLPRRSASGLAATTGAIQLTGGATTTSSSFLKAHIQKEAVIRMDWRAIVHDLRDLLQLTADPLAASVLCASFLRDDGRELMLCMLQEPKPRSLMEELVARRRHMQQEHQQRFLAATSASAPSSPPQTTAAAPTTMSTTSPTPSALSSSTSSLRGPSKAPTPLSSMNLFGAASSTTQEGSTALYNHDEVVLDDLIGELDYMYTEGIGKTWSAYLEQWVQQQPMAQAAPATTTSGTSADASLPSSPHTDAEEPRATATNFSSHDRDTLDETEGPDPTREDELCVLSQRATAFFFCSDDWPMDRRAAAFSRIHEGMHRLLKSEWERGDLGGCGSTVLAARGKNSHACASEDEGRWMPATVTLSGSSRTPKAGELMLRCETSTHHDFLLRILNIGWSAALHKHIEHCLVDRPPQLDRAELFSQEERANAGVFSNFRSRQRALASLIHVRLSAGKNQEARVIARKHFKNETREWSSRGQTVFSAVRYLQSMVQLVRSQAACRAHGAVIETVQFVLPQARLCEQMLHVLAPRPRGAFVLRFSESRSKLLRARLYLLKECWHSYAIFNDRLKAEKYFQDYVQILRLLRLSQRNGEMFEALMERGSQFMHHKEYRQSVEMFRSAVALAKSALASYEASVAPSSGTQPLTSSHGTFATTTGEGPHPPPASSATTTTASGNAAAFHSKLHLRVAGSGSLTSGEEHCPNSRLSLDMELPWRVAESERMLALSFVTQAEHEVNVRARRQELSNAVNNAYASQNSLQRWQSKGGTPKRMLTAVPCSLTVMCKALLLLGQPKKAALQLEPLIEEKAMSAVVRPPMWREILHPTEEPLTAEDIVLRMYVNEVKIAVFQLYTRCLTRFDGDRALRAIESVRQLLMESDTWITSVVGRIQEIQRSAVHSPLNAGGVGRHSIALSVGQPESVKVDSSVSDMLRFKSEDVQSVDSRSEQDEGLPHLRVLLDSRSERITALRALRQGSSDVRKAYRDLEIARGDALRRLLRWEDALEAYTNALLFCLREKEAAAVAASSRGGEVDASTTAAKRMPGYHQQLQMLFSSPLRQESSIMFDTTNAAVASPLLSRDDDFFEMLDNEADETIRGGQAGDFESSGGAEKDLRAVVAREEHSDYHAVESLVLSKLAKVHCALDNAQLAIYFHKLVLLHATECGDVLLQYQSMLRLARLYTAAKMQEEAREMWEKVSELAKEYEDAEVSRETTRNIVSAQEAAGMYLDVVGSAQELDRLAVEAEGTADATADRRYALEALANAHLELAQFDKCLEALDQREQVQEKAAEWSGKLLSLRARALLGEGKSAEAIKVLQRWVVKAKQLRNYVELGKAHVALAQAYSMDRSIFKARRSHQSALDAFALAQDLCGAAKEKVLESARWLVHDHYLNTEDIQVDATLVADLRAEEAKSGRRGSTHGLLHNNCGDLAAMLAEDEKLRNHNDQGDDGDAVVVGAARGVVGGSVEEMLAADWDLGDSDEAIDRGFSFCQLERGEDAVLSEARPFHNDDDGDDDDIDDIEEHEDGTEEGVAETREGSSPEEICAQERRAWLDARIAALEQKRDEVLADSEAIEAKIAELTKAHELKKEERRQRKERKLREIIEEAAQTSSPAPPDEHHSNQEEGDGEDEDEGSDAPPRHSTSPTMAGSNGSFSNTSFTPAPNPSADAMVAAVVAPPLTVPTTTTTSSTPQSGTLASAHVTICKRPAAAAKGTDVLEEHIIAPSVSTSKTTVGEMAAAAAAAARSTSPVASRPNNSKTENGGVVDGRRGSMQSHPLAMSLNDEDELPPVDYRSPARVGSRCFRRSLESMEQAKQLLMLPRNTQRHASIRYSPAEAVDVALRAHPRATFVFFFAEYATESSSCYDVIIRPAQRSHFIYRTAQVTSVAKYHATSDAAKRAMAMMKMMRRPQCRHDGSNVGATISTSTSTASLSTTPTTPATTTANNNNNTTSAATFTKESLQELVEAADRDLRNKLVDVYEELWEPVNLGLERAGVPESLCEMMIIVADLSLLHTPFAALLPRGGAGQTDAPATTLGARVPLVVTPALDHFLHHSLARSPTTFNAGRRLLLLPRLDQESEEAETEAAPPAHAHSIIPTTPSTAQLKDHGQYMSTQHAAELRAVVEAHYNTAAWDVRPGCTKANIFSACVERIQHRPPLRVVVALSPPHEDWLVAADGTFSLVDVLGGHHTHHHLHPNATSPATGLTPAMSEVELVVVAHSRTHPATSMCAGSTTQLCVQLNLPRVLRVELEEGACVTAQHLNFVGAYLHHLHRIHQCGLHHGYALALQLTMQEAVARCWPTSVWAAFTLVGAP